MHSRRPLQNQLLVVNANALLILRNHLTRRAKQGHDPIIAGLGTE
jgi:hypothetical protein